MNIQTSIIIKILIRKDKEINSIDFSTEKDYLITSGYDDKICIYDLNENETVQSINSKIYHCDNTIYIPKGVLTSSSRDFRVIYWSLETNEMVHSFLGHSDKITEIIQNPVNDKYFLTSSLDQTSRIWDMSKRSCLMIIEDSTCASFDSKGKFLSSVSYEYNKKEEKIDNYLNIYSLEHIQEGPFKVFKLEGMSSISQIKFTMNGLNLIAKDTNNLLSSYDAFDDSLICRIKCETNLEVGYKFKFDIYDESLAIGSTKGNVYIWDTNKGNISHILEYHPANSHCVKFFPKTNQNLLATACKTVAIWKN